MPYQFGLGFEGPGLWASHMVCRVPENTEPLIQKAKQNFFGGTKIQSFLAQPFSLNSPGTFYLLFRANLRKT
jgi:hypothetical protein